MDLTFTVAGTTDPGGSNKTNQDDYFIWQHPTEKGSMVLGMLDGTALALPAGYMI
jgi:serine/threonine protein phosphatase PrpC